MWYVGLDVHAHRSTYCVLDENGRKLKKRTVRGSPAMVIAALSEIEEGFAVCFEASDSYGYVYDRLRKVAERVAVGHPGAMRLIFRSKRKNDRIDAEKLAKLLFLDEVPEVWVPPAEMRSWRTLINHRSRLVGRRCGVKSRLRSLLRSRGIDTPKSLWSKKGLQWVRELEFANDMDGVLRDSAVLELEELSRMIRDAERVLNRLGRSHPGVQLLRTIPGVGPRTAEAAVAYIGDPHRFKSNKAVGSYFGLVPCQDSSADRNRLGHITQDGPSVVRRLLDQAAWRGIACDPRIRGFYERVRRDDPERKKLAIVATMHYLVRVMQAMLRTGEPWRSSAA